MSSSELKETRERKGITLQDATQALKISKTYLLALEAGEFHELPEPVFARGYIRNYCQFLEVDPKGVFDAYNEFLATREPVTYESLKPPPRAEKGKLRFSRFSIGLISGGLFLIFIVAVVSHQIKKEKGKLALRAKLETELAHNASDVLPEPGRVGETRAGGEVNGADKGGLRGGAEAGSEEPSKPGGAGEQEIRGLHLDLEARELTWLYVVPDSGSPIDVTLYPGDKLRIKAKKTIKFKLGNAGGVDATLNGRKIGPLGKSGEVVEKILYAGEQG